MQIPVQIAFRDIPPSPALEDHIRDKAAWLEQFHPDVIGCRVVIEKPHRHHVQGNLYHVRVDITVPGEEIIVSRDPRRHHAHEDAYVAIRDAFDAARRRLEDHARRRRGMEKVHVAEAQARVAKLFPERGYGFLETADGREIYFHANSVLAGGFAALEIGLAVRFVEEAGESGPQASTVEPIA